MRSFSNLISSRISSVPCVVSIGTFDGVHRGHKHLLHLAKECAQSNGAILVVFSFSDTPLARITSSFHKHALLQQEGVDILVEVPLASIRQISAQSFLSQLEAMFPITAWAAGEDVRFGHMQSGDKNLLKTHTEEQGQCLIITQKVRLGQDAISSTLVRQAIQDGDISRASSLLGRPYSFFVRSPQESSRVVSLEIGALCLPPSGVWEVSIGTHSSQNLQPAIVRLSKEHLSCDLFLKNSFLPLQGEVEVIFSKKISRLVELAAFQERASNFVTQEEIVMTKRDSLDLQPVRGML